MAAEDIVGERATSKTVVKQSVHSFSYMLNSGTYLRHKEFYRVPVDNESRMQPRNGGVVSLTVLEQHGRTILATS